MSEGVHQVRGGGAKRTTGDGTGLNAGVDCGSQCDGGRSKWPLQVLGIRPLRSVTVAAWLQVKHARWCRKASAA